jgi:hypothetical protein
MGRTSTWTGLFGSRAPKPNADPRVRWFGKLPSYADYYSSRTDEAWVLEFNDWIRDGFELYLNRLRTRHGDRSQDSPSGVRRLPLTVGAIRLPKSGMTAFASIQDYGGDMVGRPFPLCFYVGVPTADWPGPTSDRLAGAARVMRELTDLCDEIVRFLNAPGGFKAVFDDRKVSLDGVAGRTSDDSWAEAAAAVPMAEWLDRARAGRAGLAVAALDTWLAVVARWGEKIAASESESFTPTLSLPLATGIDTYVQTAGWLRWLESRMNLGRRRLSFLVTDARDRQEARLIVIARDPSPEDFLLLTPLGPTLRYVDEISSETGAPGRDEDAGTGRPDIAPLLIGSWRDFAQAAAKLA